MCNLNIIIKKEIKDEKDLLTVPFFLDITTKNSFLTNRDGEGIFTENLFERSIEKIDLFKYFNELINSDIIITHQRLATSGFSAKYTQPFKSKEFVLVHNGVINDFLLKKGSDTYGFFRQFLDKFNEIPGRREKRIIKAIKKLLEKLNYGSYSIALFDRTTRKLYYFKNETTDIHFYKNHELLYITTLDENKKFLRLFKNKFKEVNIKDNIIYRIDPNLEIQEVGKIKQKTSYKKNSFWDFKEPYNYNFKFYPKKKEETIISTNQGHCRECGKLTYCLTPFYERVCEDCRQEYDSWRNNERRNYIA